MPGAFSHLGFCERLRSDRRFTDLLPEFGYHPEYADFGSLGPDYLFFHPDDWVVISQLYDALYPVYGLLDDVIELFQLVSAAQDRVLDWITGGLYGDIANQVAAVKTLIYSFSAKFITESIDFFELIKPPLNENYTFDQRPNWWWIDLGHHVRTGDLLRAMWARATTAPLKAYCAGYATHIAGDVIGHAYVNGLTGGPYRNHWRRHVLVERCLDTQLWQQWYGERLSNSHAHQRFAINADIAGPQLPGEFIDFLAGALNDIYSDLKPAMTADHINFMYHGMYNIIKRSSSLSLLNLPIPEEFDWFDLPEFIRKRLEDLTSSRPPVSLPSGPINLDKIKQFIRSLVTYILWLVEYAVTIVTLPLAALSRLANTPIRYLLWLALRGLSELYQSIRLALALGAYVHPEPEMLQPHFRSIVWPTRSDWNRMLEGYPFQRWTNDRQTYHLIHPSGYEIGERPARREPPGTRGFPNLPVPVAGPDFLFAGGGHLPQIKALFDVSTLSSISDLNALLFGGNNNGFVSANELTLAIIEDLVTRGGRKVPNWNLDGDRGYGWPTWRTMARQDWPNLDVFEIDR